MYHELGHYPTENGIAVSPYEIWLPPTHTFETNNHHGEFEARYFGKNVLLLMVRNLKCNQWDMPIDQHDWVHYNYKIPKPPTLEQGMKIIEQQLDCGGLLKIKHKGKGYVERLITDEDYQRCITSYNQEKYGNR